MRGLFVTGTDTGVGKTQVACALVGLLARAGLRPAAMKPAESGCAPDAPEDALALRAAAGASDPLDRVCPYRLREPLAPAVAARREGRALSLQVILDAAAELGRERPLVVEGAGGLLVPLTERETFADLARALGLPAVVVARAGLGTINHCALTAEALAVRGIAIKAIVLNRCSAATDASEADNAAEIARLTGARVLGPLPHVVEPRARQDQISSHLASKLDPLEWLA